MIVIRDIFNDNDVLEQLNRLYQDCSDYFAIHGMSQRWAAEETLLQIQMDPDRHLFGVFMPDKVEILGAAEIKAEYPASGFLTIGWMLIAPWFRGKGIGSELLRYIELQAVKDWNMTELFVSISEHESRAETFLIRNGFVSTRKQRKEKQEGNEFTVTLFEKRIGQDGD